MVFEREAFGLGDRTTAKLMAWKIAHEITTVEMSELEKVKSQRLTYQKLLGRWVNGKKDGSVTIYYKDGTTASKIWKDRVKIQ